VVSSWFKGKGAGAASAPVYVPLLPIPVNARRTDEARIALTIGINGCIGRGSTFVEKVDVPFAIASQIILASKLEGPAHGT
jgi:hypothetical protein